MVMMMLVFIWGFSEAVWFFIIPDVILSLHALRTKQFKYVLYTNLICVTGAMAGGVCVFIWSSLNAEQAEAFMTGIPAVHSYMIEHVHDAMAGSTFAALVTGPLFGVPYKLFAAAAPEYTGIILFLLFTVPARLLRFIAVSSTAFVLSNYIFKSLSIRLKIIIWCFVWVAVYLIYFSIHSPF